MSTRNGRRLARLVTFWGMTVAATAAESLSAPEVYVLQPGDSVQIFVVGLPEMDLTQRVDGAGHVTIWLAGSVPVAGLSVADARSRVASLLDGQIVTRRVYDGTEAQTVIEAEEVIVRVAEYRPVFVDGDVAAPGAQAFMPGLTVRQAIARAGGYDLVRARMVNPFLAQADIAADEAELRRERARLRVAQARNAAERRGERTFDPPPFDPALARAEVVEMVELELVRAATRAEQIHAERASLDREIDYVERRIVSLEEQQSSLETAETRDRGNVERLTGAFDRGLTPIVQLIEAQRAASDTAERLSDVRGDLFQAYQQLESTRRRRIEIDADLETALGAEQRDIAARLGAVEARLASALDKLSYVGELRLRRLRLATHEIALVLHRNTPRGPTSTAVALDTPLMPGDTIEVVLPVDTLLRPEVVMPPENGR